MSSAPTPRTPSAVANEDATSITSYLVAGPVTYGGIGYLADRWLGTGFLTAVGVLLGLALALYVVYVRYGKPASSVPAGSVTDDAETTLSKETS